MYSSLNLTSKTPLNKEELRKVRIILKALCEHNQASDFKQPVDWKGMNLVDYPSVVKHPIDLGTIDKNIKNQKYESVEEILDHIQLVWDNCKLYNLAGSWFFEIAQKIERNFKKMVRNYFPDITIVIPLKPAVQAKGEKQSMDILDPEEDITYFQKLDFSEKVQALDEADLEKLIKWIEENCPEALRNVSDERVQIMVDNFNPSTFSDACLFIRNMTDGMFDKAAKKLKPN